MQINLLVTVINAHLMILATIQNARVLDVVLNQVQYIDAQETRASWVHNAWMVIALRANAASPPAAAPANTANALATVALSATIVKADTAIIILAHQQLPQVVRNRPITLNV